MTDNRQLSGTFLDLSINYFYVSTNLLPSFLGNNL